MTDAATLLTRCFTADDQEAFARLTGDRNPMHMDADAARRTQAGAPVVHGMHALLWALDALAAAGVPLGGLAEIKADFARFVHLGRPVSLAVIARSDTRLKAEIRSDGIRATAIDLTLGPRASPAARLGAGQPHLPARAGTPDPASFSTMTGRLGAPDGAAHGAEAGFAHLAAALGVERTVSLALLSTLVGMVVPGLHSIFSGLRLAFDDAPPDAPPNAPPGDPQVGYEVRRWDERFRLASLAVTGTGFAGEVAAFQRYAPVAPPSLDALAGLVVRDEFASRRALVIGGSRGIGAVTAMLLAAGGAGVALSYRHGRAEAQVLREQIAARRGPEACTVLAYDTAGDAARQLAGLSGPVSHLYYFATGPIFAARGAVFDPARFEGFFHAYVRAFHALVTALLDRGDPLHVLYPSSIAVETRPRDMTEYAMAKAAGEILCADLARAHRGLAITAPRLPRILTDQTATVPPVPAADPVAVMLPLLRAQDA